mgnify:CR=1 FL=1
MDDLKTKLLNTGIVVDNEYLTKYVTLVYNNKSMTLEKHKTQKHHVIPKYYYKFINQKVDNSFDNIVILYHKDHVLAHYYLALCSSRGDFRYYNELSVRHALNHSNFKLQENYDQDVEFLQSLDEYQNLMDACNSYKRPRELVERIAQSLKKVKHSSEWIEKVRQANLGRKLSEEHKEKIRQAHQNRICITKNNKDKLVKKEELDFYLKDGWVLGSSKKGKPKQGDAWNKGLTKDICPKLSHKWSDEQKSRRCGSGNPMYGKHKSKESIQRGIETRKLKGSDIKTQETKNKISQTLNGYVVIKHTETGEIKHVRPELMEIYLNEGFFPTAKKYKGMTKTEILNKMKEII